MDSRTAHPLQPSPSVLILRAVQPAALRFQSDMTGFSRPDVVMGSQTPIGGVFVREESLSTGNASGITYSD